MGSVKNSNIKSQNLRLSESGSKYQVPGEWGDEETFLLPLPIYENYYLFLTEIRRDGDTQSREALDFKHVKLLQEQIEDGQALEPITVFFDGHFYWLADGFHRWQAHYILEEEMICCTIYQGTLRDAILYSVGANADHKPALPRSRADKRKAVMTLLTDPEWSQWSDRSIAKQCKVSNSFVSNLRRSLTVNVHSENERTYTTKHGSPGKMKITKIGRTKKQQDSAITELERLKQKLNKNSESKPRKVEVNTNDILVAFVSNLDRLSEAQIEFMGKEIATRSPKLAEVMAKAIAAKLTDDT